MHLTKIAGTLFLLSALAACNTKPEADRDKADGIPIQGTWKLIRGTLIEKNDTVVTNYDKGVSFIKVINGTHFAFMQHDLNKGTKADSIYTSGGGTYTLKDSSYTEQLEYCSAREWEGNEFHFTVKIEGDTLTQMGIENIPGLNIDRVNIEKYIRETAKK